MQLYSLSLENWCQHEKRVIQFAPGLTAIRGPNGSGKSNLVNGLVFALTGNYRRAPGNKDANIYQLAPSNARSGVSLSFNHSGADITVSRWLRPTKRSLKIKGDEKEWTKDVDVNNKITDILGVNERLLLDYVFVEQWKIFDFIDQDPTIRTKAFAELFNAEKAEQIYKAMGDNKIEVPIPAIDADKVRLRLKQYREEVKEVDKQLAKYVLLADPFIAADNHHHKVISSYMTQFKLKREVSDIEKQLTELDSLIDRNYKQKQLIAVYVANGETSVGILKPRAEAAKAALSSWTSFEAVSKNKTSLEIRKRTIEVELAITDQPEPPEDYCGPDYSDIKHQIDKLRFDLENKQKFIRTFDQTTGVTKCPTCDTPTLILTDRLQEATEAIPPLKVKLDKLERSLDNSKHWDKHCRSKVDRLKYLQTTLVDVESQLSELESVAMPAGSKAELKKVINEFEAAEATSIEAITRYRSVEDELARLEGKQEMLKKRLVSVMAEMPAEISFDTMKASEGALAHLVNSDSDRHKLRIRREYLLKLIQDDESALAKAEKDIQDANKLRRVATHLGEVRETFHELPKLASQLCLEEMLPQIDDMLERFDAPFRIDSVENLKFVLKKFNGVRTPAERLSGGQRVLFALAFRVVVNSMFAKQLGLLCLDEPTAGLDEDNLKCVEVALGRLRELSLSRGLQVIIITHDKELDRLFDRVIELPPA